MASGNRSCGHATRERDGKERNKENDVDEALEI